MKTEKTTKKEYVPFGDEWRNEVKKLPKDYIIDQWKESYIKVQELEEKNKVLMLLNQ